jgi:hypothetical protein
MGWVSFPGEVWRLTERGDEGVGRDRCHRPTPILLRAYFFAARFSATVATTSS